MLGDATAQLTNHVAGGHQQVLVDGCAQVRIAGHLVAEALQRGAQVHGDGGVRVSQVFLQSGFDVGPQGSGIAAHQRIIKLAIFEVIDRPAQGGIVLQTFQGLGQPRFVAVAQRVVGLGQHVLQLGQCGAAQFVSKAVSHVRRGRDFVHHAGHQRPFQAHVFKQQRSHHVLDFVPFQPLADLAQAGVQQIMVPPVLGQQT